MGFIPNNKKELKERLVFFYYDSDSLKDLAPPGVEYTVEGVISDFRKGVDRVFAKEKFSESRSELHNLVDKYETAIEHDDIDYAYELIETIEELISKTR